ncbi:unnamed protein product [Bursaphelenchus xylophilus]|uniref:(pine wood nematode) hypothetical protein n=1 Tax=Bursaphelenchus xylophilus TaxID=6326 RepID=A0A1I7SVC6_BURXY|nr:unnamed protein product [Bursaphelenchus xylophilus]CAG9101231.1 unnamed protein product [Bursaphelenchus xylophilus]
MRAPLRSAATADGRGIFVWGKGCLGFALSPVSVFPRSLAGFAARWRPKSGRLRRPRILLGQNVVRVNLRGAAQPFLGAQNAVGPKMLYVLWREKWGDAGGPEGRRRRRRPQENASSAQKKKEEETFWLRFFASLLRPNRLQDSR